MEVGKEKTNEVDCLALSLKMFVEELGKNDSSTKNDLENFQFKDLDSDDVDFSFKDLSDNELESFSHALTQLLESKTVRSDSSKCIYDKKNTNNIV